MITILHGIGGSHAQSLANEHSDEDHAGVISYPTREFWRINGQPQDSVVGHEPYDYSFHELGKFMALAAKSNPTVLEVLHLTDYIETEPIWGDRLIEIRDAFPSKNYVHNAYLGYAESQFRKYMQGVEKHEAMQPLPGNEAPDRIQRGQSEERRHELHVPTLHLRGTQSALLRRSGQDEAGEQGQKRPTTSHEQSGSPLASPAAGVRNLPSAVRGPEHGPIGAVQDLQATGDAGSGPRSPHRRNSRPALPSMQPRTGALQGPAGSAPRGTGVPRTESSKHLRHTFRLLEQGQRLYTTGELRVQVDDPDYYRWVSDLTPDRLATEFTRRWGKFTDAETVLPDQPDWDRINGYLAAYRRAHIDA